MQQHNRRSSGAKAIALDKRLTFARYQLYLFLTLLLSAALAFGLHILFWR